MGFEVWKERAQSREAYARLSIFPPEDGGSRKVGDALNPTTCAEDSPVLVLLSIFPPAPGQGMEFEV